MKKDPTSIEYCEGMSWRKAEEWLRSNAHMLALGKSKDGADVARSLASGAEAGTAVLAAFLALRKNGIGGFIDEAVSIYREAAKEILKSDGCSEKVKEGAKMLAFRVHNLEYYTSFVLRPPRGGKFVWPLEMPAKMWADLNKRCGLANVMMGVAIKELSEDVTTEFLAGAKMAEFLRDGLEGREHG